VQNLQALGFSEYESRLYVGLLTGGPQNGNELSRTTGVPSSKVYAMLERLASKGIVATARRGKSVKYVSIPPNDLLHQLREQYTEPLEYLEEHLRNLTTTDPEPKILFVGGLEAMVEHARSIIRGCSETLYLSVWQEELDAVSDVILEAGRRNVQIAGMLYGPERPEVGWWQCHSYQETVSSRTRGRMLTVVADGAEALIAHVPDSGSPSGVRTQNPVLVLVAEEYLVHDLTLQKAKTMTGYDEWDKWLRSDDQVRKLTLGRTGRLSSIDPTAGTSA
jgi:HTH-type transcriptional regulator, sugar sensing transcriptional regulator